MISVTGGKLTTYREMAEDTVDEVCDALGVRRKSTTKRLRLAGADGYRPPVGSRRPPTSPTATAAMPREVAALVEADPSLGDPLVPGLPYTKAEAVYAARAEMAMTLDDVLSRRTRARLFDRRRQ